jgi:hypothetical protein
MIWMIQKNTESSYKTADGISNPRREAVRAAGMIFNDLKANNFLMSN